MWIMKGDHDAVPRHVRVGLEVAVPERDGRAERLQGVLGRLLGAAAVGDRDGRRPTKERVARTSPAAVVQADRIHAWDNSTAAPGGVRPACPARVKSLLPGRGYTFKFPVPWNGAVLTGSRPLRSLTSRHQSEWTVRERCGRALATSTSPPLRSAASAHQVFDDGARIVIDLETVGFLDSARLGILVGSSDPVPPVASSRRRHARCADAG